MADPLYTSYYTNSTFEYPYTETGSQFNSARNPEGLTYSQSVLALPLSPIDRIKTISRSFSENYESQPSQPSKFFIDKVVKFKSLYPSLSTGEIISMSEFVDEFLKANFLPTPQKFQVIPCDADATLKGLIVFGDEGGVVCEERYVMKLHGMGKHKQTYRATHLDSYKEMAVSFISKTHTSKKEINNELSWHRALKRIQGCVTAEKIFEGPDHVLIVTPFCKGGTMEREINLSLVVKDEVIIKELYEVTKTFMRIHDMKVIYGDAKPDNFVYDIEHGEKQIKVIDFGTMRNLKQRNPITGPILFLPPEVLDIHLRSLKINELKRQYEVERATATEENKQDLNFYKKRIASKQKSIQEAYAYITQKLDVYMLAETFYIRKNKGKLPPLQEEFAKQIYSKGTSIKVISNMYLSLVSEPYPFPKPSKKKFLDHLIWSMLLPDPKSRPSMYRINALLRQRYPKIIAKPLT